MKAPELPLARRIANGDRAAEGELVARFEGRVFAMVLARTGRAEVASDLTQEVLLGVLEALRQGRLRQADRLAAFVRGAARNHIGTYFRTLGEESEPLPELVAPASEGPFESLVSAERRSLVQSALDRVSEDERTVLTLTLVEGLTPGEIAARLAQSPEVIRKRKSRALKKVRTLVGDLSRKGGSSY